MIFTGQMTKPTVSEHWRKPVGRRDQAWIPPEPLYHVAIIQLYATASTHSVRVPMWQTQSVGPVRTAHVSVLLTVNIVSHNPALSSSDNIHLGALQPRGLWDGSPPVGPGAKPWQQGLGDSFPKAEAVCRHHLQILTAEMIKMWILCTVHLLILDPYVSRWGLSDIFGALTHLAQV